MSYIYERVQIVQVVKQMKEENAAILVEKYMRQIYSFVSKRVSNPSDVEDLTQEICLKLYNAVKTKEIIAEESFVWTVAKHTLANYYRAKEKTHYLIGMDELDYEIADDKENVLNNYIQREDCKKIQKEIAYLNKLQRRIVIAFYYDGKKQTEIASELDIPIGTVKWHLNVAKAELKKGMEKMRHLEELKFNPINFSIIGMSGYDGTMGAAINFFRSALSQNIVYCIYKKEMTIEEIADVLAVSPVYVESELEFLEKYSMVINNKGKYIANILIDEMYDDEIERHRAFYEPISMKIANRLYDEIVAGDYLNSNEIIIPDNDKNAFMWSLIFYLLAWGEADIFEEKIKFDDVAELRADGGKNIITASVETKAGEEYIKEHKLDQLCGPCWNGNGDVVLWLIDGDWTEKRVGNNYGGPNIQRDLKLLKRFYDGEKLTEDDYAFLCQKGYIKKCGDDFVFNIAVLAGGNTKERLLELTKNIKNEIFANEAQIINEYKEWYMANIQCPKHLRKQKEFGLQYLFHSDGWFMIYAKKALVESGRLKPLKEEQRISATEVLVIG